MNGSQRARLGRLEAIEEAHGGREPGVVILPINDRDPGAEHLPPGSVLCLIGHPGGRQESFHVRPGEEHLHVELAGMRLTEGGIVDLPPDGLFITPEGHQFERVDSPRDRGEPIMSLHDRLAKLEAAFPRPLPAGDDLDVAAETERYLRQRDQPGGERLDWLDRTLDAMGWPDLAAYERDHGHEDEDEDDGVDVLDLFREAMGGGTDAASEG